jgi:DNA-binding response OmpR family regulator
MTNILIIEDDTAIATGLKTVMESEDYNVTTCNDGITGYETALKTKFDFMILDINLPGKNGIDICRDLRDKDINLPILMLTSRKEEIDKVVGLEVGADDYLTKPFSVKELIARVKAILRRVEGSFKKFEEYHFGNIYVNFVKQEANKNGKEIRLTTMEYKILHYFICHKEEVITREKLLDEVWGYDAFPTTRTVDNYILALRKKIEDNPSSPDHLKTVYTSGYKFVT